MITKRSILPVNNASGNTDDITGKIQILRKQSKTNKTPAMHRDIFRFQLANNRHENFPPGFPSHTKTGQSYSAIILTV